MLNTPIKKNIFVKSCRIKDWIHILGLPLLGIIYASRYSLFTHKSLLALIISSLYLAHGYSLNNYFDLKYNIFIPQRGARKILFFSYFLLFINCIISYFYSLSIFLLLIIGDIAGLIYSAPPLRFKKNIFLNLFLNSFGFSLLFLIGFISANQAITISSIIMTSFFGLHFVPLQLIHQISHLEEDRNQHIPTFYNKHGAKITIFLFKITFICIAFWTLLIPISKSRSIYLFFITILLFIVLNYALRNIKTDNVFNIKGAVKIRLFFRKAYILYGLIVSIIIYS